jgi:inhibitor of cysteine peptidase
MLMLPLIVIVIIGLLCACSAGPTPVMSTRQLSEADAGRLIELRAGDKLEITLPGNPTTGFQWEVSVGNTAILQPSGEPEFKPSSNAVGSGGKITLRFEAVGSGQMALKLIYHRPFEKDVPPSQTFEVTLTVR